MAEEVQHQESDEPCFSDAPSATPKAAEGAVESADRGLFGFGGKKEDEKCEERAMAAGFGEKVQVSTEKKDEGKKQHEGLLDKPHLFGSSPSEEENGEKKKKNWGKKKGGEEAKPTPGTAEKKGLLGKIKEKIHVASPEAHHEEKEKKGFFDKIKEKIPGYGPSKTEEGEEEDEAANY